MNKKINRDHQTTNKIFDNRSLEVDYATLIPILKKGMRVLDVGCGTGAISERVGIWSKVANLKQKVEEGYISEDLRLKAIKEYDEWVIADAKKMVMKLNEVRGKL